MVWACVAKKTTPEVDQNKTWTEIVQRLSGT